MQTNYADYVGNIGQAEDYEEVICTWYSFVEKANNYSSNYMGDGEMKTVVMSSGANFFQTVFGSLASLLGLVSGVGFALTTFLTMFTMTVQNYHSSQGVFKSIFSQHKQ